MAEVKPFVWGSSGVELLQSGDTLAGVSAGENAVTLIATATVSSPVATVDFTGLTSEYYKYTVEYYNLLSVDSYTTLQCQFQIDSAWATSGYSGFFERTRSAGSPNPEITVEDSPRITYGPYGISNNNKATGKVEIYMVENAGYKLMISHQVNPLGALYRKYFYYYGTSPAYANPVTGLRFVLESGNIASGVFKLYGAKA